MCKMRAPIIQTHYSLSGLENTMPLNTPSHPHWSINGKYIIIHVPHPAPLSGALHINFLCMPVLGACLYQVNQPSYPGWRSSCLVFPLNCHSVYTRRWAGLLAEISAWLEQLGSLMNPPLEKLSLNRLQMFL